MNRITTTKSFPTAGLVGQINILEREGWSVCSVIQLNTLVVIVVFERWEAWAPE